ncbi:hypothetical protein MP228_004978 [Amoeboaphelidium protococcarum]|nr:hypothetical protein MP228_004978 [Amoeboaphelidium protococcarum]
MGIVKKLKKFAAGVVDKHKTSNGSVNILEENLSVIRQFELVELLRLGLLSAITCFDYDCCQNVLALGTFKGEILLINKDGDYIYLSAYINDAQSSGSAIKFLKFQQNQGLLISNNTDNEVIGWNLIKQMPDYEQCDVTDKITCIELVPKSPLVLLGTVSGSVVVMNGDNGSLSSVYQVPCLVETPESVLKILCHPHFASIIFVAYSHGGIVSFDLNSKAALCTFICKQENCSLVDWALTNDGRYLCCVYSNSLIRIISSRNANTVLWESDVVAPSNGTENQILTNVWWSPVDSDDRYSLIMWSVNEQSQDQILTIKTFDKDFKMVRKEQMIELNESLSAVSLFTLGANYALDKSPPALISLTRAGNLLKFDFNAAKFESFQNQSGLQQILNTQDVTCSCISASSLPSVDIDADASEVFNVRICLGTASGMLSCYSYENTASGSLLLNQSLKCAPYDSGRLTQLYPFGSGIISVHEDGTIFLINCFDLNTLQTVNFSKSQIEIVNVESPTIDAVGVKSVIAIKVHQMEEQQNLTRCWLIDGHLFSQSVDSVISLIDLTLLQVLYVGRLPNENVSITSCCQFNDTGSIIVICTCSDGSVLKVGRGDDLDNCYTCEVIISADAGHQWQSCEILQYYSKPDQKSMSKKSKSSLDKNIAVLALISCTQFQLCNSITGDLLLEQSLQLDENEQCSHAKVYNVNNLEVLLILTDKLRLICWEFQTQQSVLVSQLDQRLRGCEFELQSNGLLSACKDGRFFALYDALQVISSFASRSQPVAQYYDPLITFPNRVVPDKKTSLIETMKRAFKGDDVVSDSQWSDQVKLLVDQYFPPNSTNDSVINRSIRDKELPPIDPESETQVRGDNAFANAQNALNERGERLQNLESKFANLATSSEDFLARAREYNRQQAEKKWYEF